MLNTSDDVEKGHSLKNYGDIRFWWTRTKRTLRANRKAGHWKFESRRKTLKFSRHRTQKVIRIRQYEFSKSLKFWNFYRILKMNYLVWLNTSVMSLRMKYISSLMSTTNIILLNFGMVYFSSVMIYDDIFIILNWVW